MLVCKNTKKKRYILCTRKNPGQATYFLAATRDLIVSCIRTAITNPRSGEEHVAALIELGLFAERTRYTRVAQ
jgi:hypothetical protein